MLLILCLVFGTSVQAATEPDVKMTTYNNGIYFETTKTTSSYGVQMTIHFNSDLDLKAFHFETLGDGVVSQYVDNGTSIDLYLTKASGFIPDTKIGFLEYAGAKAEDVLKIEMKTMGKNLVTPTSISTEAGTLTTQISTLDETYKVPEKPVDPENVATGIEGGNFGIIATLIAFGIAGILWMLYRKKSV